MKNPTKPFSVRWLDKSGESNTERYEHSNAVAIRIEELVEIGIPAKYITAKCGRRKLKFTVSIRVDVNAS